MKKNPLLLVAFIAIALTSCGKDDNNAIVPMGETKVYQLESQSDPTISAIATFTENKDGSATVVVELNGTSQNIYPTHIHFNSAAEGGDVAITLESIDCECEFSTTVVKALDNGSPITYADLLNFDGHIDVHISATNLETLIAKGNIGSNINQ